MTGQDFDSSGKYSRRAMLKAMGGAGISIALAACGASGGNTGGNTPGTGNGSAGGGVTPTTGSSAVSTTPTVATGGQPTVSSSSTGAASPAVSSTGTSGPTASATILDSGAKLPTGNVAFQWMDSGDLKKPFEQVFFDAYQKKHPNIKITYSIVPAQKMGEVLPVGFRSEKGPDVFTFPNNIEPAQAIAQGWVQPLNDNVPNFEKWKQRFPEGVFLPGITDFNGKTYTWPLLSPKFYANTLFYNIEYMQAAGYDPEKKPLTWEEFRDAAKKITKAGKGKYYGWIIGGNKPNKVAGFVRNMGALAGASAGADDIDYKTGEYAYTKDEWVAAMELILSIQSDGSVVPGALSLDPGIARTRFPQGTAGMMMQGPWCIPQWEGDYPDFNFGISSAPLKEAGKSTPIIVEPGGGNKFYIFGHTKYPKVAGDLFYSYASEDNMIAYMELTGGARPCTFPEANKKAKLSPHSVKANALYDQQTRIGPWPSVRNPDVSKVITELKTPQPDIGHVVQGLLSGQIKDPKKQFKDLKDRSDKALDDAIKAAKAKGAKVSREDWVFPNWDPTKDYTLDDYKQLEK